MPADASGLFEGITAGIGLSREFGRTRALMEDREAKRQAQETLQGLQQQIQQAEAPARLAREEWMALEDKDENEGGVNEQERAAAQRKMVATSIDALNAKQGIFAGLLGAGNDYITEAVTPLMKANMQAFQSMGQMLSAAGQQDVELERESRLRAEGQEGIRQRGEEIAQRGRGLGLEERRTAIMEQEEARKAELYKSRKPMQKLEDELKIADFIFKADTADWTDAATREKLPEGTDLEKYRDPNRYLSDEAKAEVASIKAYLKDLNDQEEEGADVAEERAEVMEDLRVARTKEGLFRRHKRERERVLANMNEVEQFAARANEAVQGLFDDFGVTPFLPGFEAVKFGAGLVQQIRKPAKLPEASEARAEREARARARE
jgi:hypothetical protein